MIVSDRHFQFRVTWRTQGCKVQHDVSLVLVYIISAWIYMMNVQFSTAWASILSTVSTDLVSRKNRKPNVIPESSKCQTFSTTPMCAFFPDHIFSTALFRAIFSTIGYCAWKCFEYLSAMGTYCCCIFFCKDVLTLTRATTKTTAFNNITAHNTFLLYNLFPFPFGMTQPVAENIFNIFLCSCRLPLEFFIAIRTRKIVLLTDSIYGTFSRAMTYLGIICSKFFITLEANFDHRHHL